MQPVALTIAGSDPSGGAGIQADLKTFQRFGVYGEAVITLLTVQNTQRVSRVEIVSEDLIEQQIRAVLEDIPPQAAKLGALGNETVVRLLARIAREFSFPLIVDPVMISKHGASLLTDGAVSAFRDELLPQATLLTPNLAEAEALTGLRVASREEMQHAAVELHRMGAQAVLVKGGHLAGEATDLLWSGAEPIWLPAERIETRHTHGTGCTYAAAITAGVAMGLTLAIAVKQAKEFVTRAIRSAPGLGSGAGPVNHLA